jgi:hypothetical protein
MPHYVVIQNNRVLNLVNGDRVPNYGDICMLRRDFRGQTLRIGALVDIGRKRTFPRDVDVPAARRRRKRRRIELPERNRRKRYHQRKQED